MRHIALALLMAPLAAAAPVDEDAATAARFAQSIETAHGMSAWHSHQAFQANIHVEFRGNVMLDGVVLCEPGTGRARIELKDGTLLVFDGQEAHVSPASSEFRRARFHLLTWTYFLCVPFKLRDPGTHLEVETEGRLGERMFETARLTFDPGVGDTPDDWYLIYRNPDTSLIEGMAYIVTYNTPRADAEREPHAITYSDFATVDGVTLPMTWQFFGWSEAEGLTGDPLGRATVSDLKFLTPPEGSFDAPPNCREDPLPQVN